MDSIADEMSVRGIAGTLKDRKLGISRETSYAEDDFKFNPYGIVRVDT
jgi:hypothetical protein